MNNHPQEIDDKFAHIVLALEEAIFEIDEIINNNIIDNKKSKEDLMTTKELAQSARDLTIAVIASVNGKDLPQRK